MQKRLSMIFVLAAALLAVVPLGASDQVGVYCLIDRVVLEPNTTAPTAVQIWGAFSTAMPIYSPTNPPGSFGNASVGDVYGPVQVGYLYFKCPEGREATCRNEWTDLQSVAGKHQVVGIGGRHATNGRVRKVDEKPTSPDAFVLNIGVVPIGQFRTRAGEPGVTNRTQYPDLIAALEAALKRK